MRFVTVDRIRIPAVALVAILCLIYFPNSEAQSLDKSTCIRVGVDPAKAPLWMVSGVWVSDRTMVWIDAWSKEVLEVDVTSGEIANLPLPWQDELEQRWNSRLLERASREGVGRPPTQGPVRVRREGDSLLLEYAVPSSTIVLPDVFEKSFGAALDASLPSLEQSEVNLMGSRVSAASARSAWREKSLSSSPPQIHSTYQIQEVGEGHLAFASVRVPRPGMKPKFEEAFVFITGDSFTDLMPELERLGIAGLTPSQIRQHRLFYMPYLAEAGGVGYALLFGKAPKLIRHEPEGDVTVMPLPDDLERPELAYDRALTPLQNDMRDYLRLQRSDLAAGIYAIDDRIYVLASKTGPDAEKQWWMIELDGVTGEERLRLQLPTRGDAAHLTVIPGEAHVALVEKAAVQPYAKKPFFETLSVTTLPTGWIVDAYQGVNPLLGSRLVSCD